MSFDVQGKLHEIFDEQQVSEKFRKREFVLEIPDGAYTQFIKFQLTQDKCNLLDQYKLGDEVKVAFNLSGKPFVKNGTTMYFTNLGAWRIEPADGGAPAAGNAGGGNYKAAAPQAAPTNSFMTDEADNDLPF
jgi:single-strand DNA-binding protein